MNSIIKIISSQFSPKEKIERLLNLPQIPHRLKVEFALFCAKGVYSNIDGAKEPKARLATKAAIDLTEAWLRGEPITEAALKNAASAASAAHAAYYAAYSAASAALTKAQEIYYYKLIELINKEFNFSKTINILYLEDVIC